VAELSTTSRIRPRRGSRRRIHRGVSDVSVLSALDDLTNIIGSFKNRPLSVDERAALESDVQFIKTVRQVVESRDSDSINELWVQVQSMRRFFGGDYLDGQAWDRFDSATSRLFEEYLKLIADIRR
jgi:hypothetical protein